MKRSTFTAPSRFQGWLWMVWVVGAIAAWGSQGPSVSRLEPPSWWVGHSWNPVRLLVEGENLAGSRVAGSGGLTVDRVSVAAHGRCLFADVWIDGNSRPGNYELEIINDAGRTAVRFEVLKPLSHRGRFQGFSPDDVIYLAMPDRFSNGDLTNDDPMISRGLLDRSKPRFYHGGDLAGVIERLPYLRDLGVTALWLTPWYDNVNTLNHLERYTAENRRERRGDPVTDYHGYGATDFYKVEEHFGDLRKVQELVASAHGHGLRVIQDQVANHTGPYHRWTTNSPTPTWYNGTVAEHLENRWETWSVVDSRSPELVRRQTLDGWFIDLLPDLNQDDVESGTYLIQNSLWWIGMTGLDAVRQDTLPYVPRTHWARWTAVLKREYPRLTVLGEMWDGKPEIVAFFQGGRCSHDGIDTGVDTLFDFPLCYAIRDVFAKGRPMTRLSQTFEADRLYADARVLVTFLGLHDMPRFLSEEGADLAGLRLAFSFLLTTRGTPLLYYGDEIGLRGGGDPYNRADFPGGFPGDPQDAFSPTGRTPDQAAVFDHVRSMLRLRQAVEPLRRGDLTVLHASDSVMVFTRTARQRTAVVAFNNGRAEAKLDELPTAGVVVTSRRLSERTGSGGTLHLSGKEMLLRLPARSASVFF